MKKLVFILTLLICLTSYGQGLDYNVFVTEPTSIAGELAHGRANFGPTLIHNIEGDLEWAISQNDSLACDSIFTDFTNKIALIRRGTCIFV